jgi:hypothetical protein
MKGEWIKDVEERAGIATFPVTHIKWTIETPNFAGEIPENTRLMS